MQTWIVGADASCDIVVEGQWVSRQHCRLEQTAEGFVLEDLGSTNGTFVNGKRISAPTTVSRSDTITLGRSIPMPWPEEAGIPAGDAIRIGRAEDNDIVLDYASVSSHHARIVSEAGQSIIEDLGSTNGTAVGAPGNLVKRQAITAEDVVFFGSVRVPAARLLRRHFALGNAPSSRVSVEETAIVVGRDKRCDIVLDDPNVSKRHVRVVRQGDDVFVEDLNSTNGTFLNGQRIRGRVRVRAGDLVGVGTTTFTVGEDGNLDQRDYQGNVAVEARAVTVDVPNKRLVEGVSLTVYPSEFVGLMGPSGAGKTTLMNAMNGYSPPSDGAVLFNGHDLYANYGQFRSVMGYVPQDDVMHGELTVRQALYFTARLRLPSDFSDEEIDHRIRCVISQLGLEGTEDVLIGSPQKKGISGGQRKRVNLAMELLTDPSVLFLDEPTSGLSSEDALTVMKVLRNLADQGKTIVLTIHQPSLQAYRLLDNLILVGKDQGSPAPGRLVYYGPAYPQAVDFFNPDGVPDLPAGAEPSPDEVLRGFSRRKTNEWAELYAAWPLKRQYVDQRAAERPPGGRRVASVTTDRVAGLRQWWTLVRRCFAVKLQDRVNSAILLAQAPIIALLIALVFGKQAAEEVTPENWPDVAGAVSTIVFLLGLAALWFGCSNSAREIVGEWVVYHRERMVNLKTPSYVASKFTVLGGLCVIQCAVLLAIVRGMAGLNGPWLPMFGLLLLTALVGLAIGLTVSTVARTSEVAIALLPLVLLPMVILAGVLQPVHKMNSALQPLAHGMPSRWAFEGLLLLESNERPAWSPPRMGPGQEPVDSRDPQSAMAAGTPGVGPNQSKQTNDGAPPHAVEPNAERDMAEAYFPRETERMGARACVLALTSILILLLAAIHVILRSRDVH
jgi:ABC-type multidrug transport system ATPase subunit